MFAAAMGASQYLYALCVPSQTLPDWIHCGVSMIKFFGRAPIIAVPDNLKSAVITPRKHGQNAVINRTYLDWARHYNITVLPAGSRKPKHKAKVECGVNILQRHVRFMLRRRRFFSLEELNTGIVVVIKQLNLRRYKRMPDTFRHERFEQIDFPKMQELPATHFEFSEWVGRQMVPNTYHVPVYGHFYSVPFAYIGKKVESRANRFKVELFCDHIRIAEHTRSAEAGGYTTERRHMPDKHRAQADRTPEGLGTDDRPERDQDRRQAARSQPAGARASRVRCLASIGRPARTRGI